MKNTKGYEYALRFVLGGLATVFTGLIASFYGPVTGGLSLAFPAIFCASITPVERHERQRKQKLGLGGTRRGQEAAAQEGELRWEASASSRSAVSSGSCCLRRGPSGLSPLQLLHGC